MPSNSAIEPNASPQSGPNPHPICGACQSEAVTFVGNLPTYIRGGSVPSSIWRCADCGTYIRSADYAKVAAQGHFDVASYTSTDSEDRLLRSRKEFFRNIIDLCEKSWGRPLNTAHVLDVGCAYGHLLDMFRERGASTTGIEIVERLHAPVRARGHTVFTTSDAIPQAARFDMITILDSLYLFENPLEELRRFHRLLIPNGCLAIRVTNRTPLFNLLRFLRRPIGDAHFGDAKHSFSYRGLVRLLSAAGFSLERLVLRERGKIHASRKTGMYYALSYWASMVLRRPLTPGLIVIARPQTSSSQGKHSTATFGRLLAPRGVANNRAPA